MDRGTRVTALYTRVTHIIPASSPTPHIKDTARRQLTEPLKLSVHEYMVHGASDEFTLNIILTHGTSFNKYLWELVIEYLLSRPELRSGISRLVAIDSANHGDSAVLNRGRLPGTACWADDSRDILCAIKHFHLHKRPVIGIGHSFGGGAMCHAAMMEPKLFAATIFIEPILFQMKAQTENVANLTLKRRDWWASADEVAAAFAKSQSFRDWDERQLRAYIEHGTFPVDEKDPSSPRKLKTPKEQEAATYLARPYPRILELLQQSEGRHHFIWGSISNVISATRREAVERLIHPPSTSQVLHGAGHLIPMTHPEALATLLAGILQDYASNLLRHQRTKL